MQVIIHNNKKRDYSNHNAIRERKFAYEKKIPDDGCKQFFFSYFECSLHFNMYFYTLIFNLNELDIEFLVCKKKKFMPGTLNINMKYITNKETSD